VKVSCIEFFVLSDHRGNVGGYSADLLTGVAIWNQASQASRSVATGEGIEEDKGIAAASTLLPSFAVRM